MPLKLCGISGMRGAFSGEGASTGALSTLLSPVLDPHMWQWPETLVTKERSSSAGGA